MISNQRVSKGYKVAPKSIKEIRSIALAAREAFNYVDNAPGMFIERLISEGVIHVVEDDSPLLAKSIEGFYSPSAMCMLMRDRDYIASVESTNGRSLFTFAHEFGHIILGHERTLNREETLEHKAFEDSEWQANTFAAEFLMPLPIIEAKDMRIPEELSKQLPSKEGRFRSGRGFSPRG